MEIFIKNNKQLPYIIVNKKNKHTYFRVKNGHLEVSKARSLSREDVLKLIDINFNKLYLKYSEITKNLLKENEIILEGTKFDIKFDDNSENNIKYDGNSVIISKSMGPNYKYEIYKFHLKSMLVKLEQDINIVLKNNRMKIRPYRFGYFISKFGSYHRFKDEITLNVILAKYSINYLYYVILHEYAHTKVFNHSDKFYLLLEKLMPNYKKYDKELKKMAIYL